MGKVSVVIVDATGNKEQKVGLPDDIKCGIIMVKLIEKIKLPSVGPDGNPISYKFIHKVTGRQLLETQTLSEAGIKDGDVLRLQPEITAGALCNKCGTEVNDGEAFCPKCGNAMGQQPAAQPPVNPVMAPPVGQPMNNMPPVQPFGQMPPVQPKKKMSLDLIASIAGMASGALSIIFGIISLASGVGNYASKQYAYNELDSAMLDTVDNIRILSGIVKTGFGFLLIAMGLISICYFARKFFGKK